MQVLVIGGSYFIGRTIVDRLLADHHDVWLLNRGSRPLLNVRQLVADRNDQAQMTGALASVRFDWIIDTSCYRPDQAGIAMRALGGRYDAYAYLSTAAVYPGNTPVPFNEDQVGPGREWEDYGWNKLLAERELQSDAQGSTRRLVIVRPPYVYGWRNTLPREAWLWARMLQRRPIWIPGQGSTPLPFVHAEDLADAILTALARSTGAVDIFNVAQRESPRTRDYVALLGELIGIEPDIRSVDYRALGLDARDFFPFRDFVNLLDTSRIQTELDWTPRFTMRDGLAETLSKLDHAALNARDTTLAVEARLGQAG